MTTQSRLVRFAPVAAAAIIVAGGLIFAGPLNPPAGSVASTYKTLTEVEPRTAINATNTPGDANSSFRITQPGSYYLTGNITGVSGRSGIEIAASDVTIDLNGFRMTGVTGSLDGILVEVAVERIAVRNGAITDWGGSGFRAASTIRGGVFACVRFDDNSGYGVTATGMSESKFERCGAWSNTSAGFNVGSHSVFTECTSTANGSFGFGVTTHSTFDRCVAEGNTSIGFGTSSFCNLTSCIASGSTAAGAAGFQVGEASVITGCTANANAGIGIFANGSQLVISRCTSRSNGFAGIAVISHTHVLECTARSNGQSGAYAGIQVSNTPTAIGNRLEGNNCSGNDYGIQVLNEGNVIIRNTCSGNTTANYDFAAANTAGAIVNAVGVNITTSNSWANIEY